MSSHAYKTGSWYLLGVLFKISRGHPRHFYMGVPHGTFSSVISGPIFHILPNDDVNDVISCFFHGCLYKKEQSVCL